MNTIMNKLIRIVAPILIISLLLMSCSASEHAGVSYKKRPALTETDEQVWLEYWQDQFDARRGKVITPPMEYPAVAHNAYQRAAQDWNLKEQEARTQTYIAWIAGSAGVLIILYIIIAASTPDTPTYSY